MSQTDIAREVVRERMEQWGLEFALDRDSVGIGFASTNILHKMMKQGFVSGGTGLEIAADAQVIELIVTTIARKDMRVACCLRGYFCGSMRRKVERYEQAISLAAKHKIPRFGLSTYLNDVTLGQNLVLLALARGAMTLDRAKPWR